MSIGDLCRTAYQVNLTADGDPVTLTAPDTTVYSVMGFINRIDAGVDPDTQEQFLQPKMSITVSLADLGGNEPDNTWKIKANDSEGNEKESFCIDRLFDRKLGFVKIMMEDFS